MIIYMMFLSQNNIVSYRDMFCRSQRCTTSFHDTSYLAFHQATHCIMCFFSFKWKVAAKFPIVLSSHEQFPGNANPESVFSQP